MPTTDLTVAGLLTESRLEMPTSGGSGVWGKSAIDNSETQHSQELPHFQAPSKMDDFLNFPPDNETLSEPRTLSTKEKTPDIGVFEDEDKENRPQEILSAACSLSLSIGPASSYSQRHLKFEGPIYADQETTMTHPDLEIILRWNPVSALKAWEARTGRQASPGRSFIQKSTAKGNQTKPRKAKDTKQGSKSKASGSTGIRKRAGTATFATGPPAVKKMERGLEMESATA